MSVRVWRPKAADNPADSEPHDPLGALRDWWRQGRNSAELQGLAGLAAEVGTALLKRTSEHFDTDRILLHAMSGAIELAASRYAMEERQDWRPGEPLRVLLAGYNGTRNTGADVRVEEMIRQFRHLFGDEHIDLSLTTLDPELTRGYFRTVKQLHMPKVFPKFLFDAVYDKHMVVACEGSMFKSKFATALSTMMTGALGLAEAQQKIGVAYGGEAGAMDRALEEFVSRHCQQSLVICRNRESQHVLARLGIPSKFGTDTAWTFEPAPLEVGRRILIDAGWDGHTPILTLCPINPFWWPVRPSVTRAANHYLSGMDEDTHYGSVYFHKASPEADRQQDRYIEQLAAAVIRFRKDHDVSPVLIGSEQLDRRACEALDKALGGGHPVIVSDEFDMYEMVSAMRCSSMMLSSRYHAIVTTMPAGVPSAGVTMDERIRNLMAERGQPELAVGTSDDHLADRCYEALQILHTQADSVRAGIDACVATNLERMGQMGMMLVDHVRSRYPDFPFREELGSHGDAWAHLPPLSDELRRLVERSRA